MWVLQQITFFLFALLALSQIHDVPNGRLPYFCWQMKRTRGRKLKVLPLFYTPAATHTDSAAILGEYQCESRAYTSAYMYVAMHCSLCFANKFFQNMFESICHVCTVCIGAVRFHSIEKIWFYMTWSSGLTCLALHTPNILFSAV